MSQNDAVFNHLKKKGPLTPLQALRLYGTLRLGARVYDLRKRGRNIKSKMVRIGGKVVARYSL